MRVVRCGGGYGGLKKKFVTVVIGGYGRFEKKI